MTTKKESGRGTVCLACAALIAGIILNSMISAAEEISEGSDKGEIYTGTADEKPENMKIPAVNVESGSDAYCKDTRVSDSLFPVDKICSLFIKWLNEEGETVYSWSRDDHVTDDNNSKQSDIDELTSGRYTVAVGFVDNRSDQDLKIGQSYILALDWPSGKGVSVTAGNAGGTITYNGTELATWELNDETGEITITILYLMDNTSFCFYFTADIVIENDEDPGGDKDAADAYIHIEGSIDEMINDTISYTITAVIPRYVPGENNGKAYVWSVLDSVEADTVYGGKFSNDMSDMKIVMTSAEYPESLIIPPIADATEEDAFAYYIDTDSDRSGYDSEGQKYNYEIYFLNRCTCNEENCAYLTERCGNEYGDTKFCTCWHYTFNAALDITCSLDVSGIIQGMEDKAQIGSNTTIVNHAYLYNGGDYPAAADNDPQYVYRPFTISETMHPDKNTADKGVGSYKIEIYVHDVNYSRADDIEITDVMDNLSFVYDSLTVTSGDTVLMLIDEDEPVGSDPDNDRGKYFSFTCTDVTDDEGEMTGGTLNIKIRYPADQNITIEYQASVVSYSTLKTGGYSNTVTLGKIGRTLDGNYEEGYSGQGGAGVMCSMTLTKTDAEESGLVLPGAVFEVYRHAEDGEDLPVNTFTTGEDGTFTFASDDEKEYWMERDVLYYVKEIEAPAGYSPDDTLYGFIFLKKGYDGTFPDGLDPENIISGEAEGGSIHIDITKENTKAVLYPSDTSENESDPDSTTDGGGSFTGGDAGQSEEEGSFAGEDAGQSEEEGGGGYSGSGGGRSSYDGPGFYGTANDHSEIGLMAGVFFGDPVSTDDLAAVPDTGEGPVTMVLIGFCVLFAALLVNLLYIKCRRSKDST